MHHWKPSIIPTVGVRQRGHRPSRTTRELEADQGHVEPPGCTINGKFAVFHDLGIPKAEPALAANANSTKAGKHEQDLPARRELLPSHNRKKD